MSGSDFALMDMAIAGVPALAFGIWQLVSINREIARDKAKKAAGLPKRPGHAVGEHRLDDR